MKSESTKRARSRSQTHQLVAPRPSHELKRPIVIVDDDPVALEMLEAQLKASDYPVLVAKDGIQALELLRSSGARIVLSDWMMPEMNGLELCRQLRADPEYPFVYFIMLTALNDTKKLVEAFKAGVNDFLAKPCELAELLARLHAGARVVELETGMLRRIRLAKRLNDRLERLNKRLKQLASTDPLTGVFNRREVISRLREYWLAAERYDHDICVAMIDVDHFKEFNDSFGHQAGDDLLRLVGTTLTSTLREIDFSARIGGDEFLVVIPHTADSGAAIALNRVKQIIQTETGGSATISFGIAGRNKEVHTIDELLRTADKALYACKKSSRSKIAQQPS